jgi:hypothetical protein
MKTNSARARLPRFGFRNGWLYFRSGKVLFRFRGWPQLAAEYRSKEEQWREMDLALRDRLVGLFCSDYRTRSDLALIPEGDALRDADTGQMCMPWIVADDERCFVYGSYHWRQFLKTLPDAFVTHAQRLRCDFFSALELFQQVPAAMDLTQHNPMLAAALARHWEFPAVGRVDWDAVRLQVRNRRRDIIGWLGFPASEATVNALERVTILGSNVAAIIQRSLAVLNDPVFGPPLTHVPLTDQTVINCLSNPLTKQWLEPRRLKKAGPKLHDYVLSLFEPINILLEAGALDLESARRLSWGKPDQRTSKWILPYLKPHVLPDAPAPTSWGIERLKSLPEQICEGAEMGHCAGSMLYLLRAADGDVAIYRVTWPVRATLALVNCQQGYWEIEDLKGPHNAEISLEHLAEIAHAFSPEVDFDRLIQDRLWAAA